MKSIKQIKGFTLIELLAVIVILAILVLIAVPSVIKMINNTKKKAFSVEAANIIKGAENAYSENQLLGQPTQNCYTLDELSQYVDKNFEGYSGSVYINPSTKEYKIWLSKNDYIINGSLIDDIEVIELEQLQPASTTCEDITILACTSFKFDLTVSAYGGEFANNRSVKKYEMLTGDTENIEEPTRENHIFNGWEIIGEPEDFSENILTMGEEDVLLIAKWLNADDFKFDLTVSAYGGEFANNSTIKKYEMLTGDTENIEEPTKANYIFNGWEIIGTPRNFNEGVLTMGTESVILIARWVSGAATTHKLNVNPDGGRWENHTNIYSEDVEEYKTRPISDPTKIGHTFDQWIVTGTPSSFSGGILRMGTSDVSIKAKWNINSYTLTVNVGLGTITGVIPPRLNYNASTTINIPTRFGYVFDGWTKDVSDSTISGTSFTMGTANTTLTAKWLPLYTYSGDSTLINDGKGNWRIKLLSDGNLKWNGHAEDKVDIFLVGGGGGAYGYNNYTYPGAGGGYNTTIFEDQIYPGVYPVDIGSGGDGKCYGPTGVAAGSGARTTIFSYSVDGGSGSGWGTSVTGGIATTEFNSGSGIIYSSRGKNGDASTPTANTGTGGGGGSPAGNCGSSGASGIVIIRNSR